MFRFLEKRALWVGVVVAPADLEETHCIADEAIFVTQNIIEQFHSPHEYIMPHIYVVHL